MNRLYTEIVISIILFFIIISFFILNNYKTVNEIPHDNNIMNDNYKDIQKDVSEDKNGIYLSLYNCITIIFIFLFIILVSCHGYIKGSIELLFIWSFFVIATPIPESGLIITLPMKHFCGTSMLLLQLFISILSLFIVYYLYKYNKQLIKNIFVGKVFDTIITTKNYSIIVISILSSLFASLIIENFIDKIVDNKKIIYLYLKLFIFTILIICYLFIMNNILNSANKF